jgi:hypothetical protein
LSDLDLKEIASALSDQTDYEHRWLIDPLTGGDRVLDGRYRHRRPDAGGPRRTRPDLHRPAAALGLVSGHGRLRRGISDERVGRRLARAIQGKGAFRRFKDELHEEYSDLLPAWYAFRDVRCAVQWLAGNCLIDGEAADRFLTGHPDPELP